ncbi:hypothetical protein LCGC14_2274080, partial [marine sediment metagenome]
EYNREKEETLSINDIRNLLINYMPPEPALDDVVYYVNTGYVKSHGDSKEIKDKETNELRMSSTLISKKDLQENPNMINAFPYLSWMDEEFIYNADVWRTIVFDKETLGWENEIGAYKINLRSKAIDTGSWHSMTYTWDGSDMKLYLDGEYQTSASMTNFAWQNLPAPDIQNTEPMRFGRWKWYAYAEQFVKTRVGAVLVYGKVLDDKEIRQNYNSLKWEFTD